MRGSAASRASRSPTASAAEPEPPPISSDRRRPRRRQRAGDGLGAEPVVDLVEQVVVGEVVEPERQPRGGEEDLLAGLLAAQERRHVLDHRAHHREGGQRARIDRARLRLGAVGVAGRQRPAGAVDAGPHRAGVAVSSRYPSAASLARNHAMGTRPAARSRARATMLPRPTPRVERGFEAELVDEPEDRVERETVEVLGAEDELVREERRGSPVGDSREQRVEVFGPRRHAADCSAAGPVKLVPFA